LRQDGFNFAVCYLLRNLLHFPAVFRSAPAVSVLCPAVSNTAIFRDEMIPGKISKVIHCIPPMVAGRGFGILEKCSSKNGLPQTTLRPVYIFTFQGNAVLSRQYSA
jgi:hypothetical protein